MHQGGITAICEHLFGILAVECPVINQLQLHFSAFTFNLSGSEFVTFAVSKQNRLFGQEVICISTNRPTRCKCVFKVLSVQYCTIQYVCEGRECSDILVHDAA
jgi:hypothetical protein